MKKLLLLSLFACITTQSYGALANLRAAATALQLSLKKAATRSFTTTTPLKKTVSDTIWQTKEGQVVRVMGDVHLPSDKPYFELLENSFKEIDKADHKTTILVEGGFNQETVAAFNKEMKERFSTLALSKLNTLTKTASFKTIELSLTTVRTQPQFLKFMESFTMLNTLVDLVANETWRSEFLALPPEQVTASKEFFLNPRSFKCFNADNIEKIDAHLREFVTQLETFITQENNSAITTLFAPSIEQTNQLLHALNHLKKIDLTKAENLTQKHFSTLDAATFIEIVIEIQNALLPVDAQIKECATLLSPTNLSSLNVTLEDAEILIRLLTTTKAHNNFITYAGLAHSLNINKALEARGFNQVKHDGPTLFEASKVMSYGLDEKTIESNNALFLDLLQRP